MAHNSFRTFVVSLIVLLFFGCSYPNMVGSTNASLDIVGLVSNEAHSLHLVAEQGDVDGKQNDGKAYTERRMAIFKKWTVPPSGTGKLHKRKVCTIRYVVIETPSHKIKVWISVIGEGDYAEKFRKTIVELCAKRQWAIIGGPAPRLWGR